MKKIVFVIVALGLAGCGADGAPFTPTGNLGLNIGPDGITPSASGGLTNGIVTLGASL